LHLGRSETLGPNHPVRILVTWIFRRTGYHFRPGCEVLDIVDVGAQKVILRGVADGDAVTMTRIEE
jgi:hypothetical protein